MFRGTGFSEKLLLLSIFGIPENHMVIQPSVAEIDCQPDTRIMLCSDGISDMLTEVEIQAILNRKKNASDTVHDLMKLALEKGGRDNATVILCQVHERKAKEPIRERLKKVLQL